MAFEWDEEKRQANLVKHGVDFRQMPELFDGATVEADAALPLSRRAERLAGDALPRALGIDAARVASWTPPITASLARLG